LLAGTHRRAEVIPGLIPRDERIAYFAKRQPHADTRLVTLAECDYCGCLEWISSSAAEAPGVAVERMEMGRCPRCASVQMRNPEVFEWVLSVIAHHEQGGGHAPTGEKPVSEPTKPFVVSWEYMDGSGGWHDFDTHEAAYDYARPFFGDPMRIWINDEVIHRGFRASDEQE
jgi:hypothetical protein